MLTVNRHLRDVAMNRIDHALGRPLDPMGETYRAHYALDAGDTQRIAELSGDPNWTFSYRGAGTVFFHVNDHGRAALRDYLRTIGDPHREFAVTNFGETSSVVATTHGQARYRKWLEISDAFPGMSFGEYCRNAKVRLARRAER